MTPSEIRTIQKNVQLFKQSNIVNAATCHKYLGPISIEEFEERVAIKNIMGHIPEQEALRQSYTEITDYYINKDSLFK